MRFRTLNCIMFIDLSVRVVRIFIVSCNCMRPFLYLFLFFIINCSDREDQTKKTLVDISEKNETTFIANVEQDTTKANNRPFILIASYPVIKDTADFIKQLKDFRNLELCAFPDRLEFKERITYYKKVKLNGSDKEYILCEYDYGDGCNAGFPWKYQLLFTPDGKLVTTLSALRFQLLKIFSNQNPFLLTVISTVRGNGGHQLFKVSADTLENVYEGYTDYQTQTYDAHQDNAVYEPNELKISIKDFNKDGYNDLAFSGKLVLIQGLTKDSVWYDYKVNVKDTISYSVDHPFKKFPVQYVYLYNAKAGHFIESKKYSKKYPVE